MLALGWMGAFKVRKFRGNLAVDGENGLRQTGVAALQDGPAAKCGGFGVGVEMAWALAVTIRLGHGLPLHAAFC